jgi:hypothetical protein
MKAAPKSEVVKQFCLELVLSDARRWFKKDYPRNYVRLKDTEKHMVTKLKRELNALFVTQNAEWDQSLKTWYESMIVRYGGAVEMLPWS